MGSYYLGLDPSLSAFGIAVIDTRKQEVILDQIRADDHHDFIMMSWSISNLWNEFINVYLPYVDNEEAYVAQEAPIASGINSGKLNALGYKFYEGCGSFSSYERIRTYQPIKLKQFHIKRGIKKYTKWDTISVVEKILDLMKERGYTILIRKSRTKKSLSLTDGEADAFMYAIRTYMDKRPDSLLTKEVLDLFPTFSLIRSIEEIKYER